MQNLDGWMECYFFIDDKLTRIPDYFLSRIPGGNITPVCFSDSASPTSYTTPHPAVAGGTCPLADEKQMKEQTDSKARLKQNSGSLAGPDYKHLSLNTFVELAMTARQKFCQVPEMMHQI